MNFKNKEDYLNQRNALLNQANELLEKNSLKEAEEMTNKIEDLDNKWGEDAIELANSAVLKDKFKTLSNLGGKEKMEDNKILEMDNVYATKEYKNAWLKNLQGKELNADETKLLNSVNGTAVIPTQTLDKIIEKLEQTSALYASITVTNIPGNISIPVENAKSDASWVEMKQASTDGEDSFDAVSLAAYKLIKTIEIGADVSAMSISSFEAFIINALYKKMAIAIENAILNGTGSNQPTGLLKEGEITNVGTFTKASMKYKDICNIISKLPTGYKGTFVMPRTLFYAEVIGMQTTDGQRVVVADAQSPAKFNILGFPVILDDYMAEDTIIFGDLEYYHLNWAKTIEVTSDTSAGFRTGSTVYRAMALADGKKTLKEAFTKFNRATA